MNRDDKIIGWVLRLKHAFAEINVRISDGQCRQICYDWRNYRLMRIQIPSQSVTVLINPVAEKKWPITVVANNEIVATFTWWLNNKVLH